jgi:tetratricopeptide (TPR) repeat protein
LCGIYRTARDKKIAGVAGDLKRLAFQRLPEVFKRPIDNDNTTVFEVADTLYRVAGPRDGLAFLVQRIESEPRWLAQSYQGGWDSFGNALADWRTQVKDLGDLEPRLLKVVLKELRRHLQTNNVRDSSIYQSESTCYWREKEDAFVKTAQDVAAENKDSNTIIGHVAEYLYWRVKRPRLAIEILLDARRRGVLEDGDQSRLAEFLQAQDRFAESVEILEPLLQRRPEGLSYRVLLMHGYFKTNRPRQLAELLAKTDALFHRENHWNEEAMSTLGHSCLENQLYQQSVAYFEEAISHLQRTRAHRGIGDGTLSGYYGGLARAYAGLKKTIEAVDAAAGEMVARGQRVVDPFQGSSQDAAESLKMVIRQSPDLDAYVAQLDRRTQESGLDNPIVRKAVGQVYLEKRDYAKAIRQLNLAAQSQPNDGQTYQALLDCYDRMGDKRGAIEQLLRWRDLARRDLKLYEDLGNRYQAMGEPGQAERAYTSLVEVLPAEAESHRRLAEIRQRQNRWDDAIAQWQEVARLGATEPTGLLGLAQALIHEHRVEQAAETLAKLKQTSWPPRFADVPNRIRLMEQECKRNK